MGKKLDRPEEWRRLYEAVIQVKKLAPWKWMVEEELFGVQNPENDEIGFVSIMGHIGEHYAVAAYLGERGLEGFWYLQGAGEAITPEMVFEIPQLQASFEDREFLHPQDRETIKQLGLKFRGRQAWPFFRRYRPGFFPWYFEAEEVRFMTHILEQTVDVASRFKANPELLEPADEDEYLVRVPSGKAGQLKWKDAVKKIPPPEPPTISISMDLKALKKLQQKPKSNQTLEIDLFMSPTPVRDKEQAPFYPYILLIVAAKSGMILGHEFLTPVPSLEAMWGKIPETLVVTLAKLGVRPREIRVSSELLGELFSTVEKDVGFKLREMNTLPYLAEAREALFDFFDR